MKKIITLLLLCMAHNSWGAEAGLDDQIRSVFMQNLGNPIQAFTEFQKLYPHIGDPNYRVGGGRSLLQYAAEYGSTPIAQFLIKKGANVNAQDGEGNTALFNARTSLPMAIFLIENGAIMDITNKDGDTAYSKARRIFDKAISRNVKKFPNSSAIKQIHDDAQEVLTYLEELQGAGASPAKRPAVAAPPAARPVPRPAHMGAGAGATDAPRTLEIETNFVALPHYKSFQAWKKQYAEINPNDPEAMIAYDTINMTAAQTLLDEIATAELSSEQLEQVFAEYEAFLQELGVHATPEMRSQKFGIQVAAQQPKALLKEAVPQAGKETVVTRLGRRVTATPPPRPQLAQRISSRGAQPSRERMAGAGAGAAQSDVTLWQQINDILLANKAQKYDAWTQGAKDAIDTVGSQIPEDSPLRAFVTHYYTRYDQLSPQDREKMVNAFKSDGALLFGAGTLKPGQKYKVRQLINTWFPTVSVRQEVEKILASKL